MLMTIGYVAPRRCAQPKYTPVGRSGGSFSTSLSGRLAGCAPDRRGSAHAHALVGGLWPRRRPRRAVRTSGDAELAAAAAKAFDDLAAHGHRQRRRRRRGRGIARHGRPRTAHAAADQADSRRWSLAGGAAESRRCHPNGARCHVRLSSDPAPATPAPNGRAVVRQTAASICSSSASAAATCAATG